MSNMEAPLVIIMSMNNTKALWMITSTTLTWTQKVNSSTFFIIC